MKRHGFLAAALTIVFLTGCPFEAKVPLGNPAPHSIDPRLVGTWIGTTGQKGDSTEVRVLAFNDAEYYVETRERNGQVARYRAYMTPVGGEQIVSINELGSDSSSSSYFLARYSITPDGIVSIRFVGEKIVPKSLSSDREGLIKLLKDHAQDPDLDDPDVPLILRPVDR